MKGDQKVLTQIYLNKRHVYGSTVIFNIVTFVVSAQFVLIWEFFIAAKIKYF